MTTSSTTRPATTLATAVAERVAAFDDRAPAAAEVTRSCLPGAGRVVGSFGATGLSGVGLW